MDKEARKYKEHLIALSKSCFIFLRRLDEIMKTESTNKRGEAIANIANQLEIANDKVRYFALGVDYHHDNKDKIWQDLKDGK